MRVWLAKLGEPLPTDARERLHRTGLLSKALLAAGHEVTWWTSSYSHSRKYQRSQEDKTCLMQDGLELRMLYAKGYSRNRSLGRVFHDKKIARRFYSSAQNETPPDIIVCSFPTPELSVQVARYAQENKIPLVMDVRDLWPEALLCSSPRLQRFFMERICDLVFPRPYLGLRAADSLVATSESYLSWALRAVGRCSGEFDSVVHLGYPKSSNRIAELEAQRFLKSLEIESEAFNICFFGALSAHYDFETLFIALKKLNQFSKRTINLLICGSGDKEKYCRHMSKRFDFVRFLGWRSQPEIQAIMRRSHIGIAPYIKGAKMSLPNKPFEYFSAGLPVVSSLDGELAEILSSRGVGVSYQAANAESLVHAIDYLMKRPELRAQMGGVAKKIFEEEYCASVTYPKYVRHLERVFAHCTEFGQVKAAY